MVHKILFIDLIPQNLNISPPVKGLATKHTNKEFATDLITLNQNYITANLQIKPSNTIGYAPICP